MRDTEKSASIPSTQITSFDHYPHQTQAVIDLYNHGELDSVASLSVEPSFGFVSSLTYSSGERRILYGNDPGINAASSERLAKDKGYSKRILKELDIACPEGEIFLLPWWAAKLRHSLAASADLGVRTTDDAPRYIDETLGYPIYVKPVDGAQGKGVQRIDQAEELKGVFDSYTEQQIKVAVVEKAMTMPDYRILVLDQELMAAYERRPLSIIGNGKDTITRLLTHLQKEYGTQGRELNLKTLSPTIERQLGRVGLTWETIPAFNQHVSLSDVSNLSAGGTSLDVTEKLHDHWRDLSVRVAKGFNLRFCGIDLACEDVTQEKSDYAVLEVNGTPGVHHFAHMGEQQRQRVRQLYRRLFNSLEK